MQAIDEDEGVAAVKEAFDLGINFFDTSPYYGDTKSETVRRIVTSFAAADRRRLHEAFPWHTHGRRASHAGGFVAAVLSRAVRIVVCYALLQVLGRGLAQLPRDQIVVATKVGRYGANTFDFR